jgi:hypothetical protein
MSEFPATDLALEGFRITREHPRSVLLLSVVEFALSLVTNAILFSLVGARYTAFLNIKPNFTEADLNNLAAQFQPLAPAVALVLLLSIPVQAVISAAIYRMVLKPGLKPGAYLALGRDELRLTLVSLAVLGIGLIAEMTVVMLFPLIAMTGPAAQVLVPVYLAGSTALLIYGAVKLSLAAPASFALGRFTVLPVWGLSKGRFWPLISVYVMSISLSLLVMLLGNVMVEVARALSHGAWQTLSEAPVKKTASLAMLADPLVLAATAVFSVFSIMARVVMTAPAAAAYQALSRINPIQSATERL